MFVGYLCFLPVRLWTWRFAAFEVGLVILVFKFGLWYLDWYKSEFLGFGV